MVKTVDFCKSGGSGVGLYVAGLTDLEVTLTVTDMATGEVKAYTNPLGRPFELVRDGGFVCW